MMKHTESACAHLCPTVCLPPSFSLSCDCCFVLFLQSPPPPHPPTPVVASSVLLSFSPFYILFVAAGRSFFSLLLFCFSLEFQSFLLPGQMCTQCYHLSVGGVTCSHGRNDPPPNTSEGVREDPSYSLIRKDRERK